MIDIILKILEQEGEAVENVDDDEFNSYTGEMEKGFKTLAENLQNDLVRKSKMTLNTLEIAC